MKTPEITFSRTYQNKDIAETVATALTKEWESCYIEEAKDQSGQWNVRSELAVKEARAQQMSLWASGVLYGKYGEYKG